MGAGFDEDTGKESFIIKGFNSKEMAQILQENQLYSVCLHLKNIVSLHFLA